jgi:threonylcarbamoyladenosine tRNA methylthiotransferase CDKAL1
MVRVAFEGYGCTLSYGESRRTRTLADEAGWETTDDASSASIVVIHTCTVIGRTERSMLRRIDTLAMSGRMVIVGGCLPRAQAEVVEAMKEELIVPVLGQDPEDVIKALGKVDHSLIDDPLFLPKVDPHTGSRPDPGRRTDAIVPIASGCLGRCSYCITRMAWGSLESSPVEKVVPAAREWLDLGFREVQLTAQDTGAWGRDLPGEPTLPDLVRAVASIEDAPSEYRIRVGMLNPDSLAPILDDIVEVLRLPRVYRFVHLPIQAGSDRILELMRRRYNVAEYLDLVARLRKAVPDVTLHTDIICGFPGEEDEEFDATLAMLKEVRPDVTNVKGFSVRPRTEAATMDGAIDGAVMKRRTRRASKLVEQLSQTALSFHEGEEVEVMVTEIGKGGTQTMMARDGRYNPVVVAEAEDIQVGQFLSVHITEAKGVYLLGEVVE